MVHPLPKKTGPALGRGNPTGGEGSVGRAWPIGHAKELTLVSGSVNLRKERRAERPVTSENPQVNALTRDDLVAECMNEKGGVLARGSCQETGSPGQNANRCRSAGKTTRPAGGLLSRTRRRVASARAGVLLRSQRRPAGE